MSQLVSAFFASCLIGVAVYLLSQLKALVVWFCQNPTMYTESVGYLPWLLIIAIGLIIGKYYNKIKFL